MVVDAYVVDGGSGSGEGGSGGGSGISDVVSFYTLPSSVLGHAEHNEIRAAYMFYTGGCGSPRSLPEGTARRRPGSTRGADHVQC
jgi:hypothetical protein